MTTKYLIISFIFISFLVIFVHSDIGGGIVSQDGSTTDFHEIGSSSPGNCDSFVAAFGLCTMNNGGGGGGYQNYQQTPIYGRNGYTYGKVNQMYNVNTGSNSGNYNGYSNNYWTCVNQYRGQYYYSYTYGKYICDARGANRYG